MSMALAFGWERSGAIRAARAEARALEAGADGVERLVRAEVLAELGDAVRELATMETARQELADLTRLAAALALQAEQGRGATGDAARADLARGMAATSLARRVAAVGSGTAELSRLLGLPAGTEVRVRAERCETSLRDEGGAPAGWTAPELRAAEARVDAARGVVDMARGLRVPDVHPEVGLRRTAGRTGLYLGVSAGLPLFACGGDKQAEALVDRGGSRITAARLDEDAAKARRREVQGLWEAQWVAAQRAVRALEGAGEGFGARWFANLDRTVTAAEARYRLGEGTLLELLDSRRARHQALDDYHAWQSEWWIARTELARLEGRPITADLICTDPFRETP